MTPAFDPARDLTVSRLIHAPRALVWSAWTDADSLSQWWIPAPARCRVATLEVRPGGGFVTEMSEDGAPFGPHLDACFLEVVERERLVFTNALTAGWRPAASPFITAVITLEDRPEGTDYTAFVMHKDPATKDQHVEWGFFDGWTTVMAQLAALAEGRARAGAAT